MPKINIKLNVESQGMSVTVSSMEAAKHIIGAFAFGLGKHHTFDPQALKERRALSGYYSNINAAWRAEIIN